MNDDRSGTAPATVAAISSQRRISGSVPREVLVGSSGLSYSPIQKLGEGGMAEVLLAYAEGTGGFSKLVVLKMMRRYLDGTSDYRGMFLEEARVSARLNHPNLVQVFEVVDTVEAPFIVMEYLEGKPLTKLRGLAAIPREMMLTIVCEALLGLHHAHEVTDFDGSPLHIVHRDVSPHNIFVTYDGVVKVLDFGIAKTIAASSQTKTGEIKGKLSYMAPEQLLGEDLDRRADVFAMGAVLWELLFGNSLWAGFDQGMVMHRLATGQIPRPKSGEALDPELDAILVRATASEREDRYQTALEMQQALDAYRERLPKVYTPREVGDALAAVFQADRTAERESIRLALKEPSLPPAAPDLLPASDGLEPESRGKAALWWLVALGAIGLAAFLGSRFVSPSATATSEAEPSAAPANARLVFRVEPAQAQVEIDGTLRGSGDFELSLPADALQHRVVVSAPGYAPASRLVRFEGVQQLDFQLNPVAAASASAAGQSVSADEESADAEDDKSENKRRGSRFRPVPRGGAVPAPQPTPPESTKTGGAACDPPYYFKDGVKTYRPECL